MEKYVMNMRTRMPEPRKQYIIRRALNEKLDGMLAHKLTLVQGGAGSGKTTLITAYLQQRAHANVKWLSLDENSNDLLLFWDYVLGALAEYMQSDAFMEYFHAGISRDTLTHMLEIAVDCLADKEDILLVLDDFHTITNEAILDSFSYLLRHAGANLHLVLLTRQEPALYLAGLRMAGQLLELRDADLKLSEEEALAFLQYTLGLRLEQAVLQRLVLLAEGWVGGLQLMASAYQMGDGNAESLRLSNRLVTEYITQEIFRHLSAQQQDFLVKTAALSYFSKEVCAQVCAGVAFEEMLASLDHMLILCIDAKRGIYRYHPILGEYLQGLFAEMAQEAQTIVHQNAAAVFAQLGDDEESLRHLLAVQDYANAMHLVLEMPAGVRAMRYTGLVPVEAAKRNVDFLYQKFFYHYINLEFEVCREIYHWLDGSGRDELKGLQGLGFLINYEALDWSGTLLTKQEIDRLPLGEASKALMLTKNATMLYYQGAYDEALSMLDAAMLYPAVKSNTFIAYFVYNMRAQVLEDLGQLQQALALYEKMEQLIAQSQSLRTLKPSFYIGLAGIQLKQMALEDAAQTLQHAMAAAQTKEDWDWFQSSYQYNVAELHFASGRIEEGSAILRQLLAETSEGTLVMYARLVRSAFASGAASTALLDFVEDGYQLLAPSLRTQDCTLLYAQCLLARGRHAQALAVLDDCLAKARQKRVYLKIVETTLLKLRILSIQGAQGRDLRNLCLEAVHYACDDSIFMPFYTAADLITQMDAQHGNTLRELFSAQERTFWTAVLRRWGKSAQALLSAREQEVLEALARGGSNKDIAAQLCISVATVKTHINSIYGKLEVNSRVAAVERARALALL